jgi:hypothetical protein
MHGLRWGGASPALTTAALACTDRRSRLHEVDTLNFRELLKDLQAAFDFDDLQHTASFTTTKLPIPIASR